MTSFSEMVPPIHFLWLFYPLHLNTSVLQVTSVQYCFCCCSVTKSSPTLCNPMNCSTPAPLPFTISRSLLKLMSIELVMPANHLILCFPLLLLSVFLSIRVFADESALPVIKKYEKNHILPMFSFPRQWLPVSAGPMSNFKFPAPLHWFSKCSTLIMQKFYNPKLVFKKYWSQRYATSFSLGSEMLIDIYKVCTWFCHILNYQYLNFYGLNCVSPKRCGSPNPSPSECDFICKLSITTDLIS